MRRGRGVGRGGAIAALVLTLVPGWATPARAQEPDPVRTAFRSGRYEEAIDAWKARRGRGEAGVEDVRGLVDALLTVGRYEEAEGVAAEWIAAHPGSPELDDRHGTALLRLGRPADAEAAFTAALEGDASDGLQAQLHLAVLEFDTGRRDTAMRRFRAFIDVYNGSRGLSPAELTAVGVACTYLGREDPDLFHDAVRAFEEAIAADADDLEPRVLEGELFLDKYDAGEATSLVDTVLGANPRHPRALLARARILQFNGEPGAMDAVDAALKVNPRLAEARAFRGRLLLISERSEEAAAEARKVLETDPRSLPALAILAASRFLAGDRPGFEEVASRALAVNPDDAELFATTAELAVQNRLYADAVDLAERAVGIDPQAWSAWGTLGINQLRLGRIDEGRTNLERAFAGDPFNVWFKNTLDLLDTFPEYRTVATDDFRLFIEAPRADLVSLYMGPLAEEALTELSDRYGYRPQTPVRIEVYRRHADFSVRTVGLAGLGALGVTFGPVIAVDAPAAPGMGEFNWGATLWHEIAHVVTLGATDNRIPRWLTEGLSVYEERRARPGWGDEADPGFLLAYLQHRLLPVSRINDGFVRPSYPGQVSHSYLQASLVCELITDDYGFDAILRMLDAYRRGLSTEEVFADVLGLAPDGLDARFLEYMEEHYGTSLDALRPLARRSAENEGQDASRPPSWTQLQERAREAPDDYAAQLTAGQALVEQGRTDEAIRFLERARELFPEHATPDGPYPALARAYEQAGDLEAAIAALREMTRRNAGHAAAWEQLASLLERTGRPRQAAEALQQTVWIDPTQPQTHVRLAELWESVERWSDAVRERRAVVALAPVGRAEALYLLARAQSRAGDAAGARRSVLLALEIAPGYAEAQDLLLRLRASGERGR